MVREHVQGGMPNTADEYMAAAEGLRKACRLFDAVMGRVSTPNYAGAVVLSSVRPY
jgi:hypothetical protein